MSVTSTTLYADIDKYTDLIGLGFDHLLPIQCWCYWSSLDCTSFSCAVQPAVYNHTAVKCINSHESQPYSIDMSVIELVPHFSTACHQNACKIVASPNTMWVGVHGSLAMGDYTVCVCVILGIHS